MHIYTAQLRPGGPLNDPDLVLIKEGFCWPALLWAVPWLLWQRLWLGLIAYVLASSLLSVGLATFGLSGAAAAVVWIGFAVLVAAQANDWRRWTLARHGYRFAGVVAASGLAAAERRVFEHWPPTQLAASVP